MHKFESDAQISLTQMNRVFVELVAESKVRHEAVLAKLDKLEKKVSGAMKAGKKRRTSAGADGNKDTH